MKTNNMMVWRVRKNDDLVKSEQEINWKKQGQGKIIKDMDQHSGWV